MSAKNAIAHVDVEIKFSNKFDHAHQMDGLRGFITSNLMPIVDRELDRLKIPASTPLIFPDLDIDLGEADYQNYQAVFETRFAEKLRKHLNLLTVDQAKKSSEYVKIENHPVRSQVSGSVEDRLLQLLNGFDISNATSSNPIPATSDSINQLLTALPVGSGRLLRKWLTLQSAQAAALNPLLRASPEAIRKLVHVVTPELNDCLSLIPLCTEEPIHEQTTANGRLIELVKIQLDGYSLQDMFGVKQHISVRTNAVSTSTLETSYRQHERYFSNNADVYLCSRRDKWLYIDGVDAPDLHSGVVSQYRRFLKRASTERIVEQLLHRASTKELKRSVESVVSWMSADDLLLKTINTHANRRDRADIYWAVVFSTVMRKEHIDFDKIRTLCDSLDSTYADVVKDRFEWFLQNNERDSTISSRVPVTVISSSASKHSDLHYLLETLFSCTSKRIDKGLRRRIADLVKQHEGATQLAELLPIEYQIAVIQFVEGKQSWQVVEGKELRFDIESRISSANNTAASWRHPLQEFNTPSHPSVATTSDNALSVLVEQLVQPNKTLDAKTSRVDINTLIKLIGRLPESVLTRVAENHFHDELQRRHGIYDFIVELCAALLPVPVNENSQTISTVQFLPGKVIKWVFLLEPLLDKTSVYANTPDENDFIGGQLSLDSMTISESIITSITTQLTRECRECISELGNPEQWSYPFVISPNGKLFWKRNKVEDILAALESNNPHVSTVEFKKALFSPVVLPGNAATASTEPSINSRELLKVDNAGLVLVAPYLPRLFEMTGYLKDGLFISDQKKVLAASLLDYVAFGEHALTHTLSREVTLNKLLCGLNIYVPIVIPIELPVEHKKIADNMLQGMMQHWDIGNTSIEGLRTTFIARHADLFKTQNDWRLTVQSETFDVLLDRVPWSYSIVRLSWMEKPVQVKWRESNG